VPLVLALAATLYAGLKATPEMRSFPGMPVAWGDWLDEHDFLKNTVGFAVLAGAAYFAFPRRVALNAGALALLVVGIELTQRLLPQRNFDLYDIVAGWLGVALATVAWRIVARGNRGENS